MKKIFALASVLLLTGCSLTSHFVAPRYQGSTTNVRETNKIKNVILFIGDGMGPNHVDAGGVLKGEPLCFDVTDENWAYHAYSNTDSRTSEGFTLDTTKSLLRPDLNPSLYDGTPSPYSPDGEKLGASGNITTYTDSAAGGSALACGIKFTNSRIGMDIDGKPVENLVEIAKGLGKKAGVVTSDNIVGATPSDFLVHVGERHLSDEIIKGVASSPVDVVLTANCDEYKNGKSTYESLFASNGFDNIAYNVSSLNSNANKVLGLFDKVGTKADPRFPSLEELTMFAIDKLDNQEGFFLMVEGSNIDKQSHSNQAGMMLEELLGFDRAVEAATKWAEGRDDTIIVVTADHETGGLYYDRNNTSSQTIKKDIKWLSMNHSRTRVDIAVWGDITTFVENYSNKFSELEGLPYWDNTDVFKLCSTYLTSNI